MKKRVKKKPKSFLQSKQQQITNFYSIAILLLILIGIIYIVNTEAYKTIGKASSALGCTEDWICSEWSVCSQQGKQARYCYDLNNCGTNVDEPNTEQDCVYITSTLPLTPEEQLAQPVPQPSREPEKTNPIPAILAMALGVVALASLGIYHGQRYIQFKSEMQSNKVSEETIHELYMYSLKRLKEGYTRQDVQQAIINEGWPRRVVNQVFISGIAA